MSFDQMQGPEFLELCSRFPLTPIEDDGSYRAALEILDRLFALDDLRTPAELEYFRTLAQFAAEYEMKLDLTKVDQNHIAGTETIHKAPR